MVSTLVSVSVITYNHESYIRQCLDSILKQKTDFPFEILIGEDGSVDGTREICQEYTKRYPQKIRLLLRKRKDAKILFGKPIGQNNFKANLSAAQGKYVAICEGDDYWTDSLKLQKQIDFLETYPDVIGCFHDVFSDDGKDNLKRIRQLSLKKRFYNEEESITKLQASYGTCSLVFRASVLKKKWPKWFFNRTCDLFLTYLLARNGKLAYLPEVMAAYRIHDGGIWQGRKNIWRIKDLIYRNELLMEDRYFRTTYKKMLYERGLNFTTNILKSGKLSAKETIKYFKNFIRYTNKKSLRDFLRIIYYFIRYVLLHRIH